MLARRTSAIVLLIAVSLSIPSCIRERIPRPPVARIDTRVDTIHGVVLEDDYYWLRDRGSSTVLAYLEEENAYTQTMMKHTGELQEKLYQEMVGRIKETDLTVPEKENGYLYYTRTEQGRQYEIICRKKDRPDAAEEILLDENVLAQGHDYFELGLYRISPNQQLMAYTVDTTGRELYTVFVLDLKTGQLRSDRIEDVYYSLEWGNDNKTIFYSVLDEALRPFEAYRHRLGTDQSADELVFHEPDQAFELYISKTKSNEFVLISLESQITKEVHYLDADRPGDPFKVISPRRHGIEYEVYHHDRSFYIVTNENAPNFKVMSTPTGKPAERFWKEFVPHHDSVKIDALEMFEDYLAVYERGRGLKQIRVIEFEGGKTHYVEFPEPVYTYRPGKNRDFGSRLLRLTYSSMVTPNTVYDYDMSDRSWTLLKQYEVLGGYDQTQYAQERLFAPAPDGRQIPISIVYKKPLAHDGRRPVSLYGYGAYGSSSEPWFKSHLLSLLDRGFIYAIAHVRGGGEMGRYWYEEGKLLNKRNTFSDFTSCAEYLIEQNYTSPDGIVIGGGSAGGLLIGAVVNMRPDLFRAAVASVPFVDVMNTMLDRSIPLTVIEYEEWGNPNEKEYFDYMMSYSPYDNVIDQGYPSMLITAGLNDARVQYWEPAKWTAKLRAHKTDNNLLILKTRMGAGHFGASGRYDELRDEAFEMAFMLNAVGIEN